MRPKLCAAAASAPDWECRRVFEVPVSGPYTFGFIPAVEAPRIDSPSYRESVDLAVEWAIAWILAHPCQTFLLAGYSRGGECASRVLMEIITPGGRLHHLRHNFIGGFTIGNPCREQGHTFPGGADPAGLAASQISGSSTPPTAATWPNSGGHGHPGTRQTPSAADA